MRKIHFVGSVPPEITRSGPWHAMDWTLFACGWYQGHADLTGVPCDIDPRWIIDYLDRLASTEYPEPVPALRVLRAGDSHDYDSMPILRPGRKRIMNDAVFSMQRTGKLKAVIDDYLSLRKAIESGTNPLHPPLPPLRLSLPSPLDLALFVFCGKADLRHHLARTTRGAWLALKNLRHFIRAMVREVAEINAYAAHRDVTLLWQLEAPSVLYAMNLVPRFLQRPVASVLAELTASAIGRVVDFDMELHLCNGDLGHQAITQGTPAQMVLFLNRLAPLLARHGIDLPPVHLPFAAGGEAPPADPAFYAPLGDLAQPWKIYAGVVDEKNPKATRTALFRVESALGRNVEAVATACGLGRRSVDAAEDAVKACAALADVDRAASAQGSEDAK